jgi:hypothetical protein
MEPHSQEKANFEQSIENTRPENSANPLLEQVKAQVSEQMNARSEKGRANKSQTGFPCKS